MSEVKSKSVKKLEYIGVLYIFILFSILHFLYSSTLIKLFIPFAATDESVFQHLKIGFFACFFYAIFEYFWSLRKNKNFFYAKACGFVSMILFIIVVFYGYTAFTHRSIVYVDIAVSFLSVLICQLISLRILYKKTLGPCYKITGIVIIIILLLCFISFTYLPPKLGIFIEESKKIF